MNGQINICETSKSPIVGLETCNTFEKKPLGIIITTLDYYVNHAALSDIISNMSVNAFTTPPKVFPLLDGLVNVEPSGGDVRIAQEGFGESAVNGNNPYQEVLTFTKGGLCLYKQLARFQGQDVRVFFVDEDFNAFGTVDSENKVKGFKVNVGVDYRKNVGSALAAIRMTMLYSNAYTKEFINITSFKVSDTIRARKEIFLSATQQDAYSVRIFLHTCSGVDVTQQVLIAANSPDFRMLDGVGQPVGGISLMNQEDGTGMMYILALDTDISDVKYLSIYPTTFLLINKLNSLGLSANTDYVLNTAFS